MSDFRKALNAFDDPLDTDEEAEGPHPEDEQEVSDNQAEAPDESVPDEESTDERDKPDQDPDAESPDEADDESDAANTADDGGDAEDEAPDNEDDVVTLTREEYNDLQNQRMMREDYSRKTEEVAREREQVQEMIEDQRKLAREISQDRALTKFLSANPEALEYLYEDPEAVRENLLGNPEAVDDFWSEYEVLRDNPGIAEKLARAKEPEEAEEAAEELEFEKLAASAAQVAVGVQHAVDVVAQEFEGVDKAEVERYVMKDLAVLPDNPDAEQSVAAMKRLYDMMFVMDGDDLAINPTLIRSKFKELAADLDNSGVTDKEAQEHNKAVDEQLKDDDGPPATKGGDGVAPTAEKPKQYASLREVLDDF